ncbi:hypothetical protein Dda_4882 [Drechslerella dactyloides]|uniref:Uncharacterized protein n=1 Tax=Drechslerella dactyloides TaxID=74499 RepID=A0AAD6IZZ1_DREDA|nr:hypothetical protein Dda_4882 [Drechslerella dactyloides]
MSNRKVATAALYSGPQLIYRDVVFQDLEATRRCNAMRCFRDSWVKIPSCSRSPAGDRVDSSSSASCKSRLSAGSRDVMGARKRREMTDGPAMHRPTTFEDETGRRLPAYLVSCRTGVPAGPPGEFEFELDETRHVVVSPAKRWCSHGRAASPLCVVGLNNTTAAAKLHHVQNLDIHHRQSNADARADLENMPTRLRMPAPAAGQLTGVARSLRASRGSSRRGHTANLS